MAYTIRWRKAVMVSVFCHILLFASAGYLSAQLLIPPVVPEQYVELELMNESQAEQQSIDSKPNSASSSLTVPPQSTATAEIVQHNSTIAPVAISNTPSMVTTGELAVSTSSTDSGASSSGPATSSSGTIGNTSSTNNSGTNGKSTSLIAPRILSRVSPSYPESARRAGIEGTVILKLQIFENGRADNISISRSSGSQLLDDEAVATIRQWRFVPAKSQDSGQAIACYTTIPISFRLKE